MALPLDFAAAPAVAEDGTLYVVGTLPAAGGLAVTNLLAAIKPDGEGRWARFISPAVLGSPLVVHGTDVIVATVDGVIRRHSGTDGEERWTRTLGRTLDGSVVVQAQGELVATGTDLQSRRFFVGLDADGNERWRNDLAFRESSGNSFEPEVGTVDAAIAGDGWVLYRTLGGVAALLPSHHLVDLRLNYGAANLGIVPLAQQGFLIAHTTGLTALHSDQSVRWSREGVIALSPPVVGATGAIFFGDAQGGFHAYSAAGQRLWTFEAGSPVAQSATLAADGTLYCVTEAGMVYALTSEGGLLWQFDTGEPVHASLAIQPSGHVIVATAGGRVLALTGGSPLASAGWPKRHGDAAHSGRIVDPPTPVGKVPDLRATDRVAIDLQWSPVPGARGYEVTRSFPGSAGDTLNPAMISLSITRAIDRSVSNAVPYTYTVRPTNILGAGPWSEAVTVTAQKHLWRHSFSQGTTSFSGPVVTPSGNVIMAGTVGAPVRGFITAYEPSGSRLWSNSLPQGISVSPLVRPDGRIVAVGVDRLWLLDEGGSVLSESPSGRSPQNDPVLGADGSVYVDSQVPTRQLNLVWPEAQRLVPLATALRGGAMQMAVLPDGGFLLQETGNVRVLDGYGVRERIPPLPSAWAVLSDGGVLRIGARTVQRFTPAGTLAWEKPFALEVAVGAMLAVDSRDGVYGATRDREAFALNSAGDLRWKSEPIPNLSPALPQLDAAGNLWFFGFWTVGVDREGRQLESLYLGSRLAGVPVLSRDGQLYLNQDSTLRAIQMPAGAPTDGGWPSKRRDSQGTSSQIQPLNAPAPPPQISVIPFVGANRIRWAVPERPQFLEILQSRTPDDPDPAVLQVVDAGSGSWDQPIPLPGSTNYYRIRTRTAAGIGPLSPVALGVSSPLRLTGTVTNVNNLLRASLPPVMAPNRTVVLASFPGSVVGYHLDGTRSWLPDGICCPGNFRFPPLATREGWVLLAGDRGMVRVSASDGTGQAWSVGSQGPTYLRDDGSACQQSIDGTRCYDSNWNEAMGGYAAGIGILPPYSLGGLRGAHGRTVRDSGVIEDWMGLVSRDGVFLWRRTGTRNLNQERPLSLGALGSDGALFTYALDEGLACIRSDGTVRWRATGDTALAQWLNCVPVLGSDGTVFGPLTLTNQPASRSTAANFLHALSPVDGTVRWRFVDEVLTGVPAVSAEGTVLAPCGTNLFALDANTGAVRWGHVVSSIIRHVQISPDGVCLLNTDRSLVILQGGAGPASSPWPMVLHDTCNTGMIGAEGAVDLRVERLATGANTSLRLRLTAKDGVTPFLLFQSSNLRDWAFAELQTAAPSYEPKSVWDVDIPPSRVTQFILGVRP